MMAEQAVLDRVRKDLYIGGQWRQASGGKTLSVEDPFDGHDAGRGGRRYP